MCQYITGLGETANARALRREIFAPEFVSLSPQAMGHIYMSPLLVGPQMKKKAANSTRPQQQNGRVSSCKDPDIGVYTETDSQPLCPPAWLSLLDSLLRARTGTKHSARFLRRTTHLQQSVVGSGVHSSARHQTVYLLQTKVSRSDLICGTMLLRTVRSDSLVRALQICPLPHDLWLIRALSTAWLSRDNMRRRP